jgi:5-methylthioribose kinase
VPAGLARSLLPPPGLRGSTDDHAGTIMTKADLIRDNPGFPWLSRDDPRGLEAFLRQRGWIGRDETLLACEKPGEGNMNLTIRARTNTRSVIVKQARPWVEKYDHIPAPWERADFESRFYQRVADIPDVASRMPRLLGADLQARALLLEDLGDATSLASLYAGDTLDQTELRALGRYLRSLHDATRGPADQKFGNRAMRELNHQHIFVIPLTQDNGLELEQFEPGLERSARQLQSDSEYRALVEQTGRRYLADGHCLIHGDYFPGSWLRTPAGIRMIDPEFCFYGDGEFDLGCAVAHFALASRPRGDAVALLRAYDEPPGVAPVNGPLLASFAATEVMRRLIGVAQLPLRRAAVNRTELLARSRRALIEQSWELLWE